MMLLTGDDTDCYSGWDDKNGRETTIFLQLFCELNYSEHKLFLPFMVIAPQGPFGACRNKTLHRSHIAAVKCCAEQAIFQPIWLFLKVFKRYFSSITEL